MIPALLRNILVIVAIILTLGLAIGTFSGHKGWRGVRSWLFFGEALLASIWAVYLCFFLGELEAGLDVSHIWYFILTGVFVLTLLIKIFYTSRQIDRTKVKSDAFKGFLLVIIAYSIVALAVVIFNLLVPAFTNNFHLAWLGGAVFLLFAIMIYIDIVRYEQFDIAESVVHFISYAIVVTVVVAIYLLALGAVYKFIFKVESPSLELYMVNAILVVIIVMLLPLINEMNFYLRRVFYDGSYNIDELVARMNAEVLGAHDIERILDNISNLTSENLKTISAYFVVLHNGDEISLVAGQTKKGLNHDEVLEINSTIANGVGRVLGRDVVLTSDLDTKSPAYHILQRHRIAAVVKMLYHEDDGKKRLLGYLLLGEKKRQRKFSAKDIQALETIVALSAIAVENTTYYSQLKTQ
jgi:hypothetical protein